jgi:hypothetical protein
LGWLEWSEEQLEKATLPAILIAEKGHRKKLELCYGLTTKQPQTMEDQLAKVKELNANRATGKVKPIRK